MINIIDTGRNIGAAFDPVSHQFDLQRWRSYADTVLPGLTALCTEDAAAYSWEKDCLPVLNAVIERPEKVAQAVESFRRVTDGLEEKIVSVFGRTIDADIVLYLGLCNGAGWVTPVGDRTAILLGIEKIVELDWTDVDAMNGLILHEAGHVYQSQFGVLDRALPTSADGFLWQLFAEGVAMVFEQKIVGDAEYFHQDVNGWKAWCAAHLRHIVESFCRDRETMSWKTQRYFGDWVRFEGHPDTGYYLGARFVRFLLTEDAFDRIIGYTIDEIKAGFERFLVSIGA